VDQFRTYRGSILRQCRCATHDVHGQPVRHRRVVAGYSYFSIPIRAIFVCLVYLHVNIARADAEPVYSFIEYQTNYCMQFTLIEKMN